MANERKAAKPERSRASEALSDRSEEANVFPQELSVESCGSDSKSRILSDEEILARIRAGAGRRICQGRPSWAQIMGAGLIYTVLLVASVVALTTNTGEERRRMTLHQTPIPAKVVVKRDGRVETYLRDDASPSERHLFGQVGIDEEERATQGGPGEAYDCTQDTQWGEATEGVTDEDTIRQIRASFERRNRMIKDGMVEKEERHKQWLAEAMSRSAEESFKQSFDLGYPRPIAHASRRGFTPSPNDLIAALQTFYKSEDNFDVQEGVWESWAAEEEQIWQMLEDMKKDDSLTLCRLKAAFNIKG